MAPYLEGVTIEQQIAKVEEEEREVKSCLGNSYFCFYSIPVLLYIFFSRFFIELYEKYIKDRYESEVADFVIANCSLNYICNGSDVCNQREIEGIIDLYIQNLTDFIHVMMKLRYNMKRKDWKLNNKQEKNKKI